MTFPHSTSTQMTLSPSTAWIYESLGRLRVDPCPVLLQAQPYRLPHERDPLLHMEHYLKARKLFRAAWKKQVAQRFSRELGSYLRASRTPAND